MAVGLLEAVEVKVLGGLGSVGFGWAWGFSLGLESKP